MGTLFVQLELDNSSIMTHPRYLGATSVGSTTAEYRFGPLEGSDDGSVFTCDDLMGNTDSATLDVQSRLL